MNLLYCSSCGNRVNALPITGQQGCQRVPEHASTTQSRACRCLPLSYTLPPTLRDSEPAAVFILKESKQASQVYFLYNAKPNQSRLLSWPHERYGCLGRKPVLLAEELLHRQRLIHVANHKSEGLLLGPVPNKPSWTLKQMKSRSLAKGLHNPM